MKLETDSNDAKRPCIHIGLPKTGTTMMQQYLFPLHSQVYFLGRAGSAGLTYQGFRDAETLEIIRSAVQRPYCLPDLEKCRRLFQKIARCAKQRAQAPVLSMETLSLGPPDRRARKALHLAEIFGDSKILITLRNPISLVHSVYSQYIKRRLIRARWGDSPGLPEIHDWLIEGLKDPVSAPGFHLDYARTIKIFADHFGRESIHISLFEDLQENPRRFLDSTCRFIGISAEEALSLISNKKANTGLSRQQIGRLIRIQKAPLRSLLFRFSNPWVRQRMLGIRRIDLPTTSVRRETSADARLVEEIGVLTREGNRYLSREWDLPLERHSYPM